MTKTFKILLTTMLIANPFIMMANEQPKQVQQLQTQKWYNIASNGSAGIMIGALYGMVSALITSVITETGFKEYKIPAMLIANIPLYFWVDAMHESSTKINNTYETARDFNISRLTIIALSQVASLATTYALTPSILHMHCHCAYNTGCPRLGR